ncbi:MAG TPA: hypothetical protein VMB83_00490 [Roseiarcus sp.]|nr:hypothetical protein [Roseiarcus sp.]
MRVRENKGCVDFANQAANRDFESASVPRKAQLNQWLPFLDTYRTMCIAPSPDFLQALEGISALRVAA